MPEMGPYGFMPPPHPLHPDALPVYPPAAYLAAMAAAAAAAYGLRMLVMPMLCNGRGTVRYCRLCVTASRVMCGPLSNMVSGHWLLSSYFNLISRPFLTAPTPMPPMRPNDAMLQREVCRFLPISVDDMSHGLAKFV